MQKNGQTGIYQSVRFSSSDQKLILLYDLAVNFALAVGSIGLIGIDVNNSCIVGAYTNYYITKDQVSLLSVNLQAYNFAVGYAQLSSILGSGVDMTHGNDHSPQSAPLRRRDLPACSQQNLPAHRTHGSEHQYDGTGIGHGQLYLGLLSGGAQNRTLAESSWGLQHQLSLRRRTTGLREVLLLMQNGICTEQYLQVLISQMDMSCAGFNKNLLCHNTISSISKTTAIPVAVILNFSEHPYYTTSRTARQVNPKILPVILQKIYIRFQWIRESVRFVPLR